MSTPGIKPYNHKDQNLMQLPLIKTHLWFKALLWEKKKIFQIKAHPNIALKNNGSRLELFSCENKGKIFWVFLCLFEIN